MTNETIPTGALMFKCRMLIMLLLASLPAADTIGQDLLNNLRQRRQNRSLRDACQCGASTPSACTCQSCDDTIIGDYSLGYQRPSEFLSQQAMPTIEMRPGLPSGISQGQPNFPGATPGFSNQPIQPYATNGPPPTANGFSPTQPGMTLGSPSDNVLSPADAPQTGSQISEDGFDLSSQFAGQGEMSGVRDLTIGDFFSGSGAVAQTGNFDANSSISIPIAGGDRRRKVSDHFSPLPVNRTFFSYHGFGDAARDVNGNSTDVQRFTFGLERMFWNNNASFEVRIPFEHGVNSQQTQGVGGTSSVTGTEFGNITFATKYLLVRKQKFSISTGVASILPTAGDGQLVLNSGTLDFQNDAYDIIPFLAYNFKPNQNSWATLTTQLDFSVRGNEVFSEQGTPDEVSGRFNDQNLYSIDLSLGRWIWSDPNYNDRLIRGLATIAELHYTTTINDTDVVDLGSATITNPFNRTDTLNATAGLRFHVGQRTFATIAGVFPLRTGSDLPFETEFNFNLSRVY